MSHPGQLHLLLQKIAHHIVYHRTAQCKGDQQFYFSTDAVDRGSGAHECAISVTSCNSLEGPLSKHISRYVAETHKRSLAHFSASIDHMTSPCCFGYCAEVTAKPSPTAFVGWWPGQSMGATESIACCSAGGHSWFEEPGTKVGLAILIAPSCQRGMP